MNRYVLMLVLLLGGSSEAWAQRAAAPIPKVAPSFFSTYTYLSYSILDQGVSAQPMPAQGVGGTLTLRPDGTYQKRLTLAANGGTMSFDQDGRFTFSGDRITFTYTDKKGQPRTDQGTFRLQPVTRLLTLTLIGYPAGNKGIYTLRAQ